MFKGFQNTSDQQQFKGFPNLNMQQANSAYGFSGVTFWLDAGYGLSTQTNLGRISRWQARIGGLVFEQTTAANQPRLILNDANYNNFPSVESDDNLRFMTTTGNFTISGDTTLIVISKVNTSQRYNAIAFGTAGTLLDGGTDAGYTGFGILNAGFSAFIIQGSTESLNTRIKAMAGAKVFINGTSETTTGTLINQILSFNQIFASGRRTGSISEILIFNYRMSDTDVADISSRINQKYALY